MVYTKLVLFGVFAVLLTGCASTLQARNVQSSGFLGEYRSLVTQGEKGNEALLRYRNPKADWASYDKILLEPVAIWDDQTHRLSSDQREDLQRLADNFYYTLYLKLSKDYQLVEKPTPGVMRIQAAITQAEKSYTSLAFASKAIPQLQAVNTAWTFASVKPYGPPRNARSSSRSSKLWLLHVSGKKLRAVSRLCP